MNFEIIGDTNQWPDTKILLSILLQTNYLCFIFYVLTCVIILSCILSDEMLSL